MTEPVLYYRGKPFCENCGDALIRDVKATLPPLDPDRAYSTDEFPSPRVLPPSDTPHECANCGAFLYLPVTEKGRRYVVNALLNYLYCPAGPREMYLHDTQERWAECYKVTIGELLTLARERAADRDARLGQPLRSGICTDTDEEIAEAIAVTKTQPRTPRTPRKRRT